MVQHKKRLRNVVMTRPEVRERIEGLGFELAGSTPEELDSFIQDQLQAWGKAFRDAGMQPE